MGCSASKPVAASASRPTRNSESFSSPSPSGSARSSPASVGRAFSLPTPLVHHPPVKKGDTHHLVSLTSTTYGSLLLIDRPSNSRLAETKPLHFSDQISLSPDSVINTWELMDGLDSDSDQNTPEKSSIPARLSPIRSRPNSIPAKPTSEIEFGGSVVKNPTRPCSIPAKPTSEIGLEGTVVEDPTRPNFIPAKPTSKIGFGGSVVKSPTRPSLIPAKPTSEIAFEGSVVKNPTRPCSIPAKPTSEIGFGGSVVKNPIRPSSIPAKPPSEIGFEGSVVKNSTRPSSIPAKMEEEISSIPPWSPKKPLWKHISEESFLAKLDPNVASTYTRAISSRQLGSDQRNTRRSSSFSHHRPPKNRAIVIYFTSLRGIRKTYEDCCFVRTIFRGFRVLVDEKDISMDSFFKRELQEKLGGGAARLPQVFIGGRHVGGAEEIREMNESGELAGMLEEFPAVAGAEMRSVCGRCGDARFVPCPNCNGSRKLFGEDGGLMRCPKCNENGLIRCPFCCCCL